MVLLRDGREDMVLDTTLSWVSTVWSSDDDVLLLDTPELSDLTVRE